MAARSAAKELPNPKRRFSVAYGNGFMRKVMRICAENGNPGNFPLAKTREMHNL
jgi:hypothetical protein